MGGGGPPPLRPTVPIMACRFSELVVDSRDRRLLLEDLGSKNGTRLRGKRVRERVELSDGDEVVFGDVRVKLRSWSSASGAETKRISRRQ